MAKYIDSPSQGKRNDSEMYFRLASAFLSPTKTKQGFMENVGMAGKEMAEYSGAKRETEQEQMKMRLEAQKLRRDMNKDEMELGVKMMEGAGSGLINPLTGRPYTKEDWTNARLLLRIYSEENSVTGEQNPLRTVEDFLPGRWWDQQLGRPPKTHQPPLPTDASTRQAPKPNAEATRVGTSTSNAAGMPTYDSNDPASYNAPGTPPVVTIAGQKKAAEEEAEENANATAEQNKKIRAANNVLEVIGYNRSTGADDVSSLIDASTSGAMSATLDLVTNAFDAPRPGAEAIARLKAIEANLVLESNEGGLGNQVSDADREMFRQQFALNWRPNDPCKKFGRLLGDRCWIDYPALLGCLLPTNVLIKILRRYLVRTKRLDKKSCAGIWCAPTS